MAAVKHICEFGTIWNNREFYPEKPTDNFNEVYLDAKSFESLKNFVAENNDPSCEIEQAFSIHRRKGKDFIRVKNYVGVIETRQGTVIEILPKIHQPSTSNDFEQIRKSKSLLLKMLRTFRNSPFKSIDQAHIKTARLPVIEIFISVFLKEMEVLLKRGIKHFYSSVEENQKYLKGRLLFSQNLKSNLVHRERFYVNFDEFRADIPQNRILKTALVYLKRKSKLPRNVRQIISLIDLFDEVKICSNLEKDLQHLKGQNRLFNYYENALKWAKIFLQNESFTSYKGKNLNTAILFPMEVLFESYVASKLKQFQPRWEISVQDRGHYLLTDLNIFRKKFRLRPDLVIQTGCKTIVADTKWKMVNQHLSKNNYNISQADMYQLYAYGKKYQAKNGSVQLALIYPHCEDFFKPLKFRYEENLLIDAIPYDFENEASCMLFLNDLI
ncbi:5-methylcytosine-specific restriction enzyme subunit McrC [Tangfeifania diversioriginum]|uniref:5-methylcytosine-specific restriction enzyme subunit McrC n=1 Tax=Tangfeifania diversioriginum TaxID=1168035 RepID=A0A1M6ICJ0_9BACT|nr:McrC family protein [Tangfeifania diversioriginum]SHJ32178.1 5-methylcytosine-specific restriction enzyme subunit McrC [Tangfeifania diversioriginum]